MATKAPNQKWVTDVTQVTINDEKGYISPIIDLYDGSIVSYAASKHPDLRLVMEMVEKAFDKIPDDTNLILHSDQGWQYQHKIYQERLKQKGVRQSMSRKGNYLDNSRAECFFSIYKTTYFGLSAFPHLKKCNFWGSLQNGVRFNQSNQDCQDGG